MKLMIMIEPMGDVDVCFAVDDNYAPYLKVTIKSLLCNRNRNYKYDILILNAGLSAQNKNLILKLLESESDVSIRFVDVSDYSEKIKYELGGYLTMATLYRLLLFSEMFSKYERVLYLDADVIVNGDVSELFFANICDKAVAGAEEGSLRQLRFVKSAMFIDGKHPYNVDNYKVKALGMKHPEDYFNAGVLLFDLKKCRETVTLKKALEILNSHKFMFNDQDVLNILLDGQVYKLDFEWNYQNCVEYFHYERAEKYGDLFADLIRRAPKIIHYVSSQKPWLGKVTLGDCYSKYEDNNVATHA